MKKYDEASVIRSLIAKRCVVNTITKVISVPRGVLGNGSWGKVDYLCHYCGYTQSWLDNKPASSPVGNDDDEKLYDKPKRKKDIGVMGVNLKRLNI